MIFGVTYLVSYLSNFMTLNPGDIITTGTPPGVGMAKNPSVFLKKGDEIICPDFTFVSTAEVVKLLGLKAIFVDVNKDNFTIDVEKIKAAITPQTSVIIPVHLFGQCANMEEINKIAKENNLFVIEDTAQAIGADFIFEKGERKKAGTIGNIGTTSFFPSKNLGCYGDGGAIFTNDDVLAEKMRKMVNHGMEDRYHYKYIGMGGRLDTIQATILLAKLPHYKKELEQRENVAKKYKDLIKKNFKIPVIKSNRTTSWGQYTLRINNRDEVQKKLKDEGIPTAIYYPVPLHLQACFKYLNYKENDLPVAEESSSCVLSLPMNAYLSDDNISYITKTLNNI